MTTPIECSLCFESFSKVVTYPCNHFACIPCSLSNFSRFLVPGSHQSGVYRFGQPTVCPFCSESIPDEFVVALIRKENYSVVAPVLEAVNTNPSIIRPSYFDTLSLRIATIKNSFLYMYRSFLTYIWIRMNTKPCPRCRIPTIHENPRSKFLRCTNCRQEWCWNCGEERRHHRMYGSCYFRNYYLTLFVLIFLFSTTTSYHLSVNYNIFYPVKFLYYCLTTLLGYLLLFISSFWYYVLPSSLYNFGASISLNAAYCASFLSYYALNSLEWVFVNMCLLNTYIFWTVFNILNYSFWKIVDASHYVVVSGWRGLCGLFQSILM
eukprot:TRINITY_DN6202_c0_g1_i1.p1 TRINITY_DN6202_c0_g1~~TRINITY_DN6202_c0_g1_i1.p1  ORF type:complete len:321 (-),score=-16.67 TRINITY_DN6202_c0_g1_i1:179-1141(-)